MSTSLHSVAGNIDSEFDGKKVELPDFEFAYFQRMKILSSKNILQKEKGTSKFSENFYFKANRCTSAK